MPYSGYTDMEKKRGQRCGKKIVDIWVRFIDDLILFFCCFANATKSNTYWTLRRTIYSGLFPSFGNLIWIAVNAYLLMRLDITMPSIKFKRWNKVYMYIYEYFSSFLGSLVSECTEHSVRYTLLLGRNFLAAFFRFAFFVELHLTATKTKCVYKKNTSNRKT